MYANISTLNEQWRPFRNLHGSDTERNLDEKQGSERCASALQERQDVDPMKCIPIKNPSVR
jgi:hypothetical protein